MHSQVAESGSLTHARTNISSRKHLYFSVFPPQRALSLKAQLQRTTLHGLFFRVSIPRIIYVPLLLTGEDGREKKKCHFLRSLAVISFIFFTSMQRSSITSKIGSSLIHFLGRKHYRLFLRECFIFLTLLVCYFFVSIIFLLRSTFCSVATMNKSCCCECDNDTPNSTELSLPCCGSSWKRMRTPASKTRFFPRLYGSRVRDRIVYVPE